MADAYFELIDTSSLSGIRLAYQTVPGGYHPPHGHYELELLYALNGDTDIIISGQSQKMKNRQLIVVESCQVHSTHYYNPTSMFICLHISKKAMRRYMPDIDLYQIRCTPEVITDEQFPAYLKLCQTMDELTRLYIEEKPTFRLETEGIILQILAKLIQDFSLKTTEPVIDNNNKTLERLGQITDYVDRNYQHPVSLRDICEYLCLNREYFCRFFKKNMGLSFLDYLNEVRITHVYQDLIETSDPIQQIMERNGFTNQKLFNQTFKKIYGCTPSSVRK